MTRESSQLGDEAQAETDPLLLQTSQASVKPHLWTSIVRVTSL